MSRATQHGHVGVMRVTWELTRVTRGRGAGVEVLRTWQTSSASRSPGLDTGRARSLSLSLSLLSLSVIERRIGPAFISLFVSCVYLSGW
eukprot:1365970-Rhodomonas_salina.1